MEKGHLWSMAKSVLATAFAAIGGVWSALEIIQVCPLSQEVLNKINGWAFTILIIAGIVGFLSRIIYLICQIFTPRFNIGETGETSIRIHIGNILNQTKGTVIIGINKEYITDPDTIAASSIHKQLLDRYPSRRETIAEVFRKHKESREHDPAKPAFFEERVGRNHVIFLPMSTLSAPHVAYTSLETVREALHGLFSAQKDFSVSEETVFCPLLGTGEAGMNLSREDTVRMIVRTFIICCNKSDLNNKIKHLTITIHPKDCWKINWITLNRDLAVIVDNCGKCELERIHL